jgi:hypothetical protein
MDYYRRPLQVLTTPTPSLRVDVGIGVLGAVVCLALTGYFRIDLARPGFLGGDHLYFLTYVKSFINGHGFRFDSQLGFPSERDNLYFPNADLTYRLCMWLAAHFTANPFRAMHAVYIVAILAMDGFTYWTLRRLKITSGMAALGALAAILTPFLARRAFDHDALAMSFSVPLALGLALSIGLWPAEVSLKRFLRDPYTLTAVIIVGASGLYYAFYAMMLAALVGVAAAIGQRRWFPALAAAGVIVPILVVVIFSGFGLDLPMVLSGHASPPQRGAYEQLFYGLNLPSLAYDFNFLPKVAAAVVESQREMPAAFVAEGVGEWPRLPLGLVLMASPLLVAIAHYWRRGRDEGRNEASVYPSLISVCAALIVFMMLFGARGGLGYIFNLLVSPQIRADARLLPFLTTAAVVVTCAIGDWALTSRHWPVRYGGPLIAGLALLLSTHGTVNALAVKQRTDLADPGKQQLIQSTQAMLKAKDGAQLKAVLQLPLASWPEVPPIHGFEPYLHQLPYLYDRRGSPTRWSYGSNERQPGVALTNFWLSETSSVLVRARQLGFDGVLIVKSAYEPAELANLQTRIGGAVAPVCRLYDDGYEVLYAINRGPGGTPC